MTGTPAFSLLLPLYRGDTAAHFRRAFLSSVEGQRLRPDEVVIVRDGPIPDELEAELGARVAASPVPCVVVELPENVGLARALTAGLEAVTNAVVARMDADDIAQPERFAVQLPMIADGLDLVGSAIDEFVEVGDVTRIVGRRTPPLDEAAIVARARLLSPFNHPSVVFRVDAVRRAGGYRDLPLLEDYWLFGRMIQAGARVGNSAEALVLYRVDSGAYGRRGGGRLLRSELRLQLLFRRDGFLSPAQFARNVLVRCGYRLVPEAVRRRLYRRALVDEGVTRVF
ncbi:glycosyltransferase [Schumannella sp. 10F1B-5-1]|uniref:glycosyltransferase n=1 Tax=Schumannella sp. 10F1B-5-1 TaxID=2590780 RepID=UPI001130E882|nr:glycosyltransferase [Schumannella sp. 10F1B-5-1]TPW73562.1 glycosyltransferase [Schumannella sp. 10F1B-5-1]